MFEADLQTQRCGHLAWPDFLITGRLLVGRCCGVDMPPDIHTLVAASFKTNNHTTTMANRILTNMYNIMKMTTSNGYLRKFRIFGCKPRLCYYNNGHIHSSHE